MLLQTVFSVSFATTEHEESAFMMSSMLQNASWRLWPFCSASAALTAFLSDDGRYAYSAVSVMSLILNLYRLESGHAAHFGAVEN